MPGSRILARWVTGFREMRVTNSAFACGVFLPVWCALEWWKVAVRCGVVGLLRRGEGMSPLHIERRGWVWRPALCVDSAEKRR
jgi:hypothetical protein